MGLINESGTPLAFNDLTVSVEALALPPDFCACAPHTHENATNNIDTLILFMILFFQNTIIIAEIFPTMQKLILHAVHPFLPSVFSILPKLK